MKQKIKWLKTEPNAAGEVGGEMEGVRQVQLAVQVGQHEMIN